MRFAHLSHKGSPVLVDPSLVGVVARVAEHPVPELIGATMIKPRHGDGMVLVYCDEDPAEAGRRIVAAAGGATTADVDEAFKEFTMSVVSVLQTARAGNWMTAARNPQEELAVALRAALAKLKETVLKAAYVAEGKEI